MNVLFDKLISEHTGSILVNLLVQWHIGRVNILFDKLISEHTGSILVNLLVRWHARWTSERFVR